ncbi:MAG: dihydrofolate reductase family protein [Stackebrandtia sp.]
MGSVYAQISVSVDGYVGHPELDKTFATLGRLTSWVHDLPAWRDRQGMEGGTPGPANDLVAEEFESTGAYVLGRNMFELGEEPWGDNPPYRAPVFVVTHRPREVLVKEGGTVFTFVTDGLAAAVEQAKQAAGDKNVGLFGGASAIAQAIGEGLLDELHLHQLPVLLGEGLNIFDGIGADWKELEATKTVHIDGVNHLYFKFKK